MIYQTKVTDLLDVARLTLSYRGVGGGGGGGSGRGKVSP